MSLDLTGERLNNGEFFMSLNVCKMCQQALRGLKTSCTIENCIQGLNPIVLKKEIKIKKSWWQTILNWFK